MKGKRYTTEEKIRVLREADSGMGYQKCAGIIISRRGFSPV